MISNFLKESKTAYILYIPVKSGVPPGSVLGPCLFLININDLAARVSSLARLFADDTFLYRFIAAADDHKVIQSDLPNLEESEADCDMEFIQMHHTDSQ